MNRLLTNSGFGGIDLHLHADGSLPADTLMTLIREHELLFSEDELGAFFADEYGFGLMDSVSVPDDCESLDEYLKCFDLPLKVLQNPNDMAIAGFGIASQLVEQGLAYAEIRFAPQLHSKWVHAKDKFKYEEMIVDYFLSGIENATQYSATKINVILCCMRNLPEGKDGLYANLRTLHLAKEFFGKGVCGLDLAGAEARDATSEFEPIFLAARDFEIPFTIHAGEAGDDAWRIDSIERAIFYGAKRIGHGIGLENSADFRKLVKDKGIVVECCPTSNLQTKAVTGGIKNHPIKMFLDEGIKVTVNTDNMTVSNTNLSKEFGLLRSAGITEEELKVMQENAIDGAFISEAEKRKLKRKLK